MTAIWMALNFVLLLLAFYLILHLYQRIRILEKKQQPRDMEEEKQLFAAHIEDIRHENEQLLSDVRRLFDRHSAAERAEKAPESKQKAAGPSSSAAPSFADTLGAEKKQLDKKTKAAEKGGTEWVPPIDDVQDQVEESPYLQAIKLQDQGYSMTEIAKRMNRGKGEVELLLKMRGKKQV